MSDGLEKASVFGEHAPMCASVYASENTNLGIGALTFVQKYQTS